jgi:hypothetical protein
MKTILLFSLVHLTLTVNKTIPIRTYSAHIQSCNVVSAYDVEWNLTLKEEGRFEYTKSIIDTKTNNQTMYKLIGSWMQINDSTLVLNDIFQLSENNCKPDSIVYKIENGTLISTSSCFDYFRDGRCLVSLR